MEDLTPEEKRERRRKAVELAFGLWKDRPGGPIDGVEYQNAIRAEWEERELDQYRGHPTPDHLIDVELNRQLRGIQEVLGQPTILVPDGMTREEARAFIIKHAENK